MGETLNVYCHNCGQAENFSIGIGFYHSSLKKAVRCTHGRVRKRLKEIVTNHSINEAEYEYRVLACPRCNTLHERFWVRVKYDGGKCFETTFRCGKCWAGLVALDMPVGEYRCGHCCSRSLEEYPGIDWD